MKQSNHKKRDVDVHLVCDYILLCLKDAGESCNVLKLQKLLYYVQAWNLAFSGEPAFDGSFEAWVHGPVNREIYSRFAGKTMYATVSDADVTQNARDAVEELENAHPDLALHIKSVLEAYGHFTGTQLEELTHSEDPWVEARKGFRANERCAIDIDEQTMQRYYASRLQ